MKKIILMLLIGILPLFGSEITERDVKSLIKEVSDAANAKDVERLAKVISKDFRFVFTIDTPEGKKEIQQNRKQNLQMLSEFFSQVQKYEHAQEIKSIHISEAEAISVATLVVTEKHEIGGEKLGGTSTQKYFMSSGPNGFLMLDAVFVMPE